MPLGIYISVPFCRTKCSYCNFASDVFSRAVFGRYVDRVCADIENAEKMAAQMVDLLVENLVLLSVGWTVCCLVDVKVEKLVAKLVYLLAVCWVLCLVELMVCGLVVRMVVMFD